MGSPVESSESSADQECFGSTSSAPIVLVLAADETFSLPLGTTLFSALTHVDPTVPVDVTILDGGLSDKSKERIGRVLRSAEVQADLHFRQPDLSRLDSLDDEISARMSEVTFYRLLIPEVLSDRQRALYVDSDIVFERSIEEFWNKQLDGKPAVAVAERTVSDPNYGIAEWQRLGLDADDLFFNAGLLLLDLGTWREEGLHHEVVEYLSNPDNDMNYGTDQEGLNAILAGRWREADPRWNVFHLYYEEDYTNFFEQLELSDPELVADRPYAIHFTGERKPWMPECDHPKRDRFEHYLKRSGWFTPPEYALWLIRKRCITWYRRWTRRVLEWSRSLRHTIGLRRRTS